MNKKGDLSILLLVFLTLLVVAAALFVFLIDNSQDKEEITRAKNLDNLYAEENQLNIYIDNIAKKSISTLTKDSNIEKDFLSNFKTELSKYKTENDYPLIELSQLETINEQNAEFDSEKKTLFFNVNLEIKERVIENEGEEDQKIELFATYFYKKTFEYELSNIFK